MSECKDSVPFEENPEWTQEMFAKSKAPAEVLSPDVLAQFSKTRPLNAKAASVPRPKKRKRPVTITRNEAILRLEDMVKSIERDVNIALAAEAALEEANNLVVSYQIEPPGSETYNSISQALGLNLALSLARLFDEARSGFPQINAI
ncbi:MAG: hypothetical protein K0S56_3113 [Microvirga sp.]|jgi:hypothetical protein|nr:hypothetical protein [Microvirga sp.]